MTRAAVATLATAATAFALPATADALALSVTTSSPQDVAATRVTFRAKVSVAALGANVLWQYGTSTRYEATTTAVGTGLLGVDQTLTLGVSGLAPDTTYHVRAVATSGLATAYGRDVKFTTAKTGSGSSGSGSGSSGDDGAEDPGADPGGTSGSGSGSTTTPATTTTTPPTAAAKGSGPQPTATPAGDPGAVTSDDGSTVHPGVATAAVTPVLGKKIGVAAVQGTVTATSPSGAPVDLSDAATVPTGTLIDARAGTVELKTALDHAGATQTGHFWGAEFEVRQSASARGLTQIVLRGGDFSACAATTRAVAATAKATKKKPPRALWGSDSHGRFQTRGRGSVATVRGTRWLTRDTCAGTLTRVAAGAVAVRDLRRGKTVVVTRGHEYLARTTR